MKAKLLLLFIIILLQSCASTQKMNTSLIEGNYDKAFTESLEKVKKSKKLNKISQTILDLEMAYQKANEKDFNDIQYLLKNASTEDYIKIFEAYKRIENRQNLAKNLPELLIFSQNRIAKFDIKNIENEIEESKKNAIVHLYNSVNEKISTTNKLEARKLYYDLEFIDKLSPNYKNTESLKNIAKQKGTDYVLVRLLNNSNKVIPKFLELDMLFPDYILQDEMWTKFDVEPKKNINYDYGVELSYDRIEISPEKLKEVEIQHAKMVKNGTEDAKSTSGEIIKDKNGNTITIDKYVEEITVTHELYQYKETFIDATINYFDFSKNKIIAEFPLHSGYVFRNSNTERRFPRDEEMIKSCTEDLKSKFRSILSENEIRRFSK